MLTSIVPISVIIPVRNEGDRLLRTVASILSGRSCRFPMEIVLVDDASTDGACEKAAQITKGIPEVTLIQHRLSQWKGIPYARNRGAELATYPLLFITDANVVFPPQWDLPIWSHYAEGRLLAATIVDIHSNFRGYGCQLLLPSMGVRWIPTAGVFGGYVPIAACTGTVIEQELFRYLGGYDESLPLYGAAESEFSVRAWLSGYEIVNVPELALGHRFKPLEAQHDFLATIKPVLYGNYLRFAFRYLPEPLLAQTYEHYTKASPAAVESWYAELRNAEVWAHRARLQQWLKRDFDWFARRFGLSGLSV